MSTTPEGKVKDAIKKLLDAYKPELYYHMAVPVGYGDQTVDFLGCYIAIFFAIEAKAPGKKPSPRQERILEAIEEARGAAFVIDGEEGLTDLRKWLEDVGRARKDIDERRYVMVPVQ